MVNAVISHNLGFLSLSFNPIGNILRINIYCWGLMRYLKLQIVLEERVLLCRNIPKSSQDHLHLNHSRFSIRLYSVSYRIKEKSLSHRISKLNV